MPAQILNGKPVAEAIKAEAASDVAELVERHSIKPTLAVIRVGEDPASAVYVGSKVRTVEELGMNSEHLHFHENTPEEDVVAAVNDLNERDDVDGILVQLPLPPQVEERKIIDLIDPAKDVDGFHPVNSGKLMQGRDCLMPCTPAGVIELLKRSQIDIAGKHAVVVGRSNIVGKPMAMLLLHENATVSICHSRTKNLVEIAREADVLVAAIGRPAFLRREHIRDGATVIDVGINRVEDTAFTAEMFHADEVQKRLAAIEKRGFTLIGDVKPKDALDRAGAYTPVPGGVGLLTVAMLMKNTVKAAKLRRGIS